MHSVDGIDLGDEEYEELKALVECERTGGDVTLAAFRSLCPTGEEGAFDERKVEAYSALLAAGFVSGVRSEGAFYFQGLEQAGVDFVDDRAASSVSDAPESSEDGPQAAMATGASGISHGAVAGQGGRDVGSLGAVAGIAAACGLFAGLIGGFAGSYLFALLAA